MGTNFYVETNDMCAARCHECGQVTGVEQIKLHLGKSSAGWSFLFKMEDGDTVETAYENWLQRLTLGQITDEYGTPYSPEELIARIAESGEVPRAIVHTVYPEQYVDSDGHRWERREFS